MKKLIFILAAAAIVSCGDKNKEPEIDLEEYNTDSVENLMERSPSNATTIDSTATDSMTTDSTATDTAQMDKKSM